MKKIVYTVLALALLMTGTGCKKFIDGYDVSPNSPSAVTNALLLSNTQVAYFATASGQLSRMSSMLVQQTTGINFQSRDINEYVILEGDNVNEWNVIYTNGIVNLRKLYAQAGAANPHYQGISKVMQALFMGVATDLWGDVPNREAGQGMDGKFSPVYDNQQVVIQDIQAYLDEAITLLSKPASANVQLPGSDDLVFQGDAGSWIATAHALKARYHNRLSKKDAAGSAANALTSVAAAKAAGLTSNDANCNAIFGQNSNEYNQWYAFTVVERAGYMVAGASMTNLMNGWSDPRLPYYCTPDSGGGYNGCPVNVQNDQASGIGPYLATPDAPFPIVSYAELLFIEAEASFRKGDKAAAATAFNDAVKASVLQVTGAANPAFEAAQAAETAGSITLEKIMTHKYVAMYGQIEAWSDWRRTGIPTLTANPDGAVSGIPRRLPTVQDERLYNPNAPAENDILKPVWWDQ
ncbi:MAG: SusD/RagB family nutrient-binding outer membrane lipoprotein [Bacteroidetes bacterium]|nr:SusD/RagB family nutrient-binding outer membrane lipoprotein [Bacteroidota bacterium]